jgi:hypothetical protein
VVANHITPGKALHKQENAEEGEGYEEASHGRLLLFVLGFTFDMFRQVLDRMFMALGRCFHGPTLCYAGMSCPE